MDTSIEKNKEIAIYIELIVQQLIQKINEFKN